MERLISAARRRMHRSTLTVSVKMGTYMPNCTASLSTRFLNTSVSSRYFPIHTIRICSSQNLIDLSPFMQLVDHHGSPGSHWSSQSWLYFEFQKAPEHVDSVRFPSGDNKNVSVIRMRPATQSTTKNIRRAFPVMQSYCWGNDRLPRGITMSVTLSIFFSGEWAGQWTDILGLTLIREILNWRRIGGDLTVKGMMYPNGQATLLEGGRSSVARTWVNIRGGNAKSHAHYAPAKRGELARIRRAELPTGRR